MVLGEDAIFHKCESDDRERTHGDRTTSGILKASDEKFNISSGHSANEFITASSSVVLIVRHFDVGWLDCLEVDLKCRRLVIVTKRNHK